MIQRDRVAWRAFLFDFDGTLVDSSGRHDEAFRGALRRVRPDLLEDFDYGMVRGMPTSTGFRRLGIENEDQVAALVGEKHRLFRASIDRDGIPLLAGARELLDMLDRNGSRLYLVTSGSRGSVWPTLAMLGISQLFDGVVTADDVHPGKPSPEPYLWCLRRFDLDPESCVAVEDAVSGVTSARGASLAVVGVHNVAVRTLVDVFFPTLEDMRLSLSDPRLVPVSGS